MIDHWLLYMALGLVCGTFGAMFGLGGGIILVPALVLLLEFPQKSAQGTCMAAMVPMALVAAIRYKMNPAIEVNLTAAMWLGGGAIFGALAGSAIAGLLPAAMLKKLFAVVLILAAVKMILPASAKSTPAPKEDAPALVLEEETPPPERME